MSGKGTLSRFVRATVTAADRAHLLPLLDRSYRGGPTAVQVLTYHHVGDGRAFEQQMQYLASTCTVIGMRDLRAACDRGAPLPPRSVLLTFDDALTSFETRAWPVLSRLGLPVTLFVPTAYPDNPGALLWWYRLEHALDHTRRREPIRLSNQTLRIDTPAQKARTYRFLRAYLKSIPHRQVAPCVQDVTDQLDVSPPETNVLGWESLRRLAREGVVLGAHTRTHPMMNRIPHDEAVAEATGSLADLRREIGTVEPIFAYPGGGFTAQLPLALRAAGFTLAFSSMRGVADLRRSDPLLLPRNDIGVRADAAVLRARLVHSRWLRPHVRNGPA